MDTDIHVFAEQRVNNRKCYLHYM